jgi:hypothetical protein
MPSAFAIFRKAIVRSVTLESISTAVSVFFNVLMTRRIRSSVHICSSCGLNVRVTHMGCDQMSSGAVSRISTIQSTYHFMNASALSPASPRTSAARRSSARAPRGYDSTGMARSA